MHNGGPAFFNGVHWLTLTILSLRSSTGHTNASHSNFEDDRWCFGSTTTTVPGWLSRRALCRVLLLEQNPRYRTPWRNLWRRDKNEKKTWIFVVSSITISPE
ncbi:hypothetical protein ElyMa_001925700 [Elysia marginata]|uniref:Secreted protein n=1 Tax=Elysia marginata TaxID=1093978 RepID=A0AAV4EV32_9GAST|nr:hypothetical protein ElyMa_001925700 [Elysia marginata]